MKILGIETSCDETAVALIEAEGAFGKEFTYRVLGESMISQASMHAEYGGVFPNLAKREHGRNLVPVLMETLRRAGVLVEGSSADMSAIARLKPMLEREPELNEYLAEFLNGYAKPDIDGIAVTVGPGLEPALWVGINFAKALAEVWDVPLVATDHMEGHIAMSAMKDGNVGDVEFPALALLVSGGHTELVLVKGWMEYQMLGATRDDAAGEAFDKTARILGLPYPGGPEISRLASEARANELVRTTHLPRPMIDDKSYEFSFSGLKTAVSREAAKYPVMNDEQTQELAREIEDAIVDVLVKKTTRAAEEFGVSTVIVGGGVSANQHLRQRLTSDLSSKGPGVAILFPPPDRSTDNGVMIALAGYFHAQKGHFAAPEELKASGNLSLAKAF
jgi:N6-L-threonylcarbamoyladenine synthase